MKLEGRTALITGANRGLGEAMATLFVAEGASVFLTARDRQLLEEVGGRLQSQKPLPDQKIVWAGLDVADLEAVKQLPARVEAALGPLTILVNNAGIYGPIGPLDEIDLKEWVEAININLIGLAAVTQAFIPGFKRQRYGKIINLSGGGATAPQPRFSAYASSKAGVVRLTETLAHELAEYKVDVNAIAPGALNTRLLDQVLAAGPEKAGAAFYQRSLKQRDEGGAGLERGAQLAVWLASAASDGISGRLLSAVWDDWANLDQKREKLQASDVFTLRRIVPEDRKDAGI
jgi:3-oxoacyl-[acyl-carrier protein] reductase